MTEYKNIMKLVDSKLADDEARIEYLRSEVDRLGKEKTELQYDVDSLAAANESLTNEIKRQDAVIQELKNAVKVANKDD